MKKEKKKSKSKLHKFVSQCLLVILIVSTTVLFTLFGLLLSGKSNYSFSLTEPVLAKVFTSAGGNYSLEPETEANTDALIPPREIEEIPEEPETVVPEEETEEMPKEEEGPDLTDPYQNPGPMIRTPEFEEIEAWTARSAYYENGNRKPINTPYPYISVTNEYYDDALFVGDSRIEGLHDYGGLDNATFAYKDGLNVFSILEEKKFRIKHGEESSTGTLEDALNSGAFKKIFIMIGVNELGKGYVHQYVEKYLEMIAFIRENAPDAVIEIMGMMYVTKTYSDASDVFNNDNINCRNTYVLEALPADEKMIYLDMNECVANPDTGVLDEAYTNDGLHLTARYYTLWVDWLNEHGLQDAMFYDDYDELGENLDLIGNIDDIDADMILDEKSDGIKDLDDFVEDGDSTETDGTWDEIDLIEGDDLLNDSDLTEADIIDLGSGDGDLIDDADGGGGDIIDDSNLPDDDIIPVEEVTE